MPEFGSPFDGLGGDRKMAHEGLKTSRSGKKGKSCRGKYLQVPTGLQVDTFRKGTIQVPFTY